MQRRVLCRSRRDVSNEYLVAKIGFDTEENEPCKVFGHLSNNRQSLQQLFGCGPQQAEGLVVDIDPR